LTPAIWIVLLACGIAAATDIAARRIPNLVTLALAIAALAVNAMQGWTHLAIAIAVLVGVTLLGFGAFSAGWLGGGDVKLLAAASAALGLPDAVDFLLYTSLAGGLLAIAVALFTGRLRSTYDNVSLLLRPIAYRGTVSVAPSSAFMLPYAVAIGCGAVLVALSHTAAPYLRLPL